MAAVWQRQPHDRVAGLEQGVEHRRVGLRARVWLHVDVLGPEQLLGAVNGQLLGHVEVLAAAVVAAAGVSLGVLVGQHRALALQHRLRHEVLGGDHLERPLLALELGPQHRRDLRIDLLQGRAHQILEAHACTSAICVVCPTDRSAGGAPRYSPLASSSHSARYSANEARTNTQYAGSGVRASSTTWARARVVCAQRPGPNVRGWRSTAQPFISSSRASLPATSITVRCAETSTTVTCSPASAASSRSRSRLRASVGPMTSHPSGPIHRMCTSRAALVVFGAVGSGAPSAYPAALAAAVLGATRNVSCVRNGTSLRRTRAGASSAAARPSASPSSGLLRWGWSAIAAASFLVVQHGC